MLFSRARIASTILLLLICVSIGVGGGYRFHFLTCETRDSPAIAGWEETANIVNGLFNYVNLCKGMQWQGLIMKPTQVIRYIDERRLQENKTDIILFLDGGDAFFNLRDISVLENYYDIARQGKGILISAEQSCFIGNLCTLDDAKRL